MDYGNTKPCIDTVGDSLQIKNIREAQGQFYWELEEIIDGILSITEYRTNIRGCGVFENNENGTQITGTSQFSLSTYWNKDKIKKRIKRFHGL